MQGIMQAPGLPVKKRPTIKEISEMPKKRYEPSDAVKLTKSALAALSMIPLAGYPASVANSVYDIGTGVKYAADENYDKAAEDIGQGILGLLPSAILTGIGLKGNKIYKQLRGLEALKKASDAKTISETPSSIYNKTSQRQQEFINGKESSISRKKSIPEPDYTDYGNSWLQKNDPFDPNAPKDLPNIGGGMTTKTPKR
jgi:hypothetical protein